MARKRTQSDRARNVREKGQRRIARLNEVIESTETSQDAKEWARNTKREIQTAINATRKKAKTGRVYKNRDYDYIEQAMKNAERAINKVEPRYQYSADSEYNYSGDTFATTETMLNMASSKNTESGSVYTQEDVKTFYRVTQKIWQRDTVSEHDRNEAILDHYNSIREEAGLSPLSLSQIVDAILERNKIAQRARNLDTTEDMTEEQKEFYDKVAQLDNDDSSKGSPPGVTQTIVDTITDALEELFEDPDFTSI